MTRHLDDTPSRRTPPDDRLDRLRGDLAALRAKAADEFGVAPTSDPAGGRGTGTATAADDDAFARDRDPSSGGDVDGWGPVMVGEHPDRAASGPATGAPTTARPDGGPPGGPRSRGRHAGSRRRSGLRRRDRPPRPPRRNPFRRRPRRPPGRLAVPSPITVRRRPSYLAAPRWPVWGWGSGAVALVVVVPAVLQLAVRLLEAMGQTSVLLGADPSRTDYLRAAAGVSGGGLTLALAVAAVAVVKGRPGYLAAAGAVLAFFGVFPFVAYTANAGIVAAPVPPLAELVRPPGWPNHDAYTLVFWLCAVAFAAAVVDLVVRSVLAVQRTVSSRAGG